MTTQELQQVVRKLRTSRIVTEQRGSWKYQDAYRLSSYHARLADNGRVLWVSITPMSQKMSWPQMKRNGYTELYELGSLHNQQVRRSEAIEAFGLRFVKDIERRGWTFGQ